MYTQNDFPIGSKARVIATGEVVYVRGACEDVVHANGMENTVHHFWHISELESVFEYDDDVEVSDDGVKWESAKYGCQVPKSDSLYNLGYRHIIFNLNALYYKHCRRASSRKSELENQIAEAREKMNKASKVYEELQDKLILLEAELKQLNK